MMSADQLRDVDCRLRQITQRASEPFGGLDVILCGDLRQLPSVRASEIYKRCRNADGRSGRRQVDRTFSDVLTKIGDGRALEDDEVGLLESRFVTADRARELAPSALRIFYSNREVTLYNESVAKAAAAEEEGGGGGAGYHVLRACDYFVGSKTPHLLENAKRKVDNMTLTEFGNLAREVLLVVDKPFMLTVNVDVVDGLVNGAVGTLRLCEFEQQQQQREQQQQPKRLWIQFDVPATGRLTRARAKLALHEAKSAGYADVARNSDYIPIETHSLTFTIDRKAGIACKRTQFPIVQASAITVHKSQGATYASVVYEYSRTHPQKKKKKKRTTEEQ
ncbi:ATP-dependent DNA helicase PIF1 [Dermacentor silvarum]|uniref:ATP-dependent DNA helicase PIF1 n=1 Tax=Dermacentor silvarum TaxID=543639 RepID=UPI001896D7A1|nr:ATP-dependent DNA helicase PIF1 [Dermacentor silvarum]